MNYYNETRTHCRWTRMRPYCERFREQGVFFAFQSWAGCITNIFGFDLRQAQLVLLSQKVAFWEFGILDNFGRFVFRHEELRWITQ
jgi:hypothetical protein